MFHTPQHLKRSKEILDIIHEDPTQEIQGGIPGEHYHLSGALYQHLINVANNPIYSEPVMTLDGDIIIAIDGDVVIELLNGTNREFGSDYTPPPIYPTTPIPDIVSPPVPTPAPVPSDTIALGPSDPYWNNVVLCAPLDEAIGVTAHVDKSQYSSTIAFAGAANADTALNQLFAKNTVAAAADNAFAIGTGHSVVFNNNFTVEWHLAWTSLIASLFDHPSADVGTSIISVRMQIAAGTAIFAVYRSSIASGLPTEYATFAFAPVSGQYYHICIERKDSTVQLSINGVIKASITCNAILTNVYAQANYYANARVTSGVARYDLLAPVVPTAPYPQR